MKEKEMREKSRKSGGIKTENKQKREKWLWLAAFALLFCAQIMTMIYFGNKKVGFHEDEYYSYYSTNRTAGLYEPDREWVDRDEFRNEFVVLHGERFRYALVAAVQSWDVHPPFFYFLLHTVCSLFPGVFSKWLGIGVNLLAFCLNFALLSWLAYMVTGCSKRLAWMVTAAHGFNPVIISGVMFIRMYEWLTVFVLLCACLHVRAVLKKEMGFGSFLFPLMAVNYLGFLTQYYYLIFLFFMAVGFGLWNLLSCVGKGEDGRRRALWKEPFRNRILGYIKYGCACGLSLLLAIISYPACLSHIFRGYRGIGAVSEFLNVENTDERLGFFMGLMNEYLFDGYLWLWLIVIAVMGGAALGKWMVRTYSKGEKVVRASIVDDTAMGEHGTVGKDGPAVYLLLLFAVCGYFFTVSKTALLLYETSNRYQLPVYGIIMLLVITAVYELFRELAVLFNGENQIVRRWAAVGGMALLVLFWAGDLHEIVSGKVIFLYEEEAADVAYAKENAHIPVIILYNDAAPYHVWWRSQELMEYDRMYFVSEGNKEQITDEVICGSDKIIVYAADYDTKEESLQMILESNPGFAGYRSISQKSLWSVYEFE